MASDPTAVSSGTKVVRNDGVAATPLGEKLALLNLAESTYYAMNPVAAAIWGLLETPRTAAELADAVRDGFEVGSADVAADVDRLLSDLLRLKLIRLADA